MPKSRIAIIDADSVLYSTACGAEACAPKQGETGEDLWFQVKSLAQCYAEVVDKLEALVDDVKASDAIICLTTTKCFRYEILPTYKANRENTRRPAVLKDLQARVQERRPFGVVCVKGLEADDVCGISAGHLQGTPLREPVVISIDKDMRQIPGLSYDPRDPKAGIVEVTEAEADRAHLYQTLIGDSTDHYTGCPGMGPKRANKLLDEIAHHSPRLQWGYILGCFQRRSLGVDYALTQARVARILRSTDWDASNKEVRLWTPEELPQATLSVS